MKKIFDSRKPRTIGNVPDETRANGFTHFVAIPQADGESLITALDYVGIPSFALDKDYRYVAFNSTHTQNIHTLYGKTIKPGNKVLHSGIAEAERTKIKCNIDKVLQGEIVVEKDYFNEVFNPNKSSEVIHIPLRDNLGSVTGVVIYVKNFNLEQNERTSPEYDQLITGFFEKIPVPATLSDSMEGRIIAATGAFIRNFGFTKEETIGKTCIELGINRNEESHSRMLTDQHDRVTPSKYQFQLFTKSGQELTVINSIISISLGGKDFILSIMQDITELTPMQKSANQAEIKLQRLFDTMMDGYVQVEIDGRIVDFNPAYRDMLGYSDEELRGITYIRITPEKWHEIERQIVEKEVLTKGYSDIYSKEYRKADGTIFPVELRAFLLRDDSGAPEGMWSIVRDITARKLIELELENSITQLRDERTMLKRILHIAEEEKKELEAHITASVDTIIYPLLQEIKNAAGKGNESKFAMLENILNKMPSGAALSISREFPLLTKREIQICYLIREGLSSKDISRNLSISLLTIHKFRQRIRKKLGLSGHIAALGDFLRSKIRD